MGKWPLMNADERAVKEARQHGARSWTAALQRTRHYTECMTAEQRNALQSVISINKEIMHGTPCFSGSRVPVQTLVDFLETGDTIDAFVAVYPSIPREQVVA